MKFPITFWRKAVRLAFPAAIAATILGGSAAFAVPADAAAPAAPASASAAFAWNDFALINNWQADTTLSNPGAPGWAVHHGVVYFRGRITDPNPDGSTVFATLPPNARPQHNVYISIAAYDYKTGYLFINKNGDVAAEGAGSATFSDLSGVSFPLPSIKTHKLALKNGWKSEQSNFGTGDPAYSVSNGIVYISGSLAGGSNGSQVATLPKAARPAHQIYLSVDTYRETTGTVEILASGAILVSGSSAASFTSLAGISYPVAGTKWHNFKLLNKWKSASASYPTGKPGYALINGVVYLTGAIYGTAATSYEWAKLPRAITPPDVADIVTYTYAGTTGSIILYGRYALAGGPGSNANSYTGLAGLSYPAST
jgi:hypothetical protein